MQKTPLSIRIIYIFSRLIYLLTIFFGLASVVMVISLLTGLFADELNMTLKLPIESDLEEIGTAYFFGHEINVTFADAEGKVNFKDAPIIVTKILAFLIMILFSMILYLVNLYYRFIKNVRNGIIFEVDNIKILRKLGISLLGFYFFMLISTQLWKHGFSSCQAIYNVSLSFNGDNILILLSALFIITLSQIFLQGLELQKENNLTI